MTIDILICTLNDGIQSVPSVFMPPMDGVGYVVSMQYTDDKALDSIPDEIRKRTDVKLHLLKGKGLSKNRNAAMALADADILVIADDDNRYKPEYMDSIRKAYAENKDAGIICFAAENYEGKPLKWYPAHTMTFDEAFERGYYPASVEITMRNASIKKAGVHFNENFGLGSEHLCAGEEDVFLKDAKGKGIGILVVPCVIVQSDPQTTGINFIGNDKMQLTKGATFNYLFGRKNAIYRSLKEGLWWMVHRGANPVPIIRNMIKGVYLWH